MRRALFHLVALFVGFGVLTVGNGLATSVVSLRMGFEGFPIGTAGLVLSAQALGFVIGPFLVPWFIHRVGHIRLFAMCAAIAAVATLTLPLQISPAPWLALRLATGIGLSGCAMILESWLNYRTDSQMRGRVLAVYMIVNYLAFSTGQFLLLSGSPADFQLFSLAAILFAVALLPVAATRIGEPERPDPQVPPLTRLWRLSPLGTVGAFAAGFTGNAFISAGPLFASARGLLTEEVALFMGLALLAALVLQLPMGRLSDRMDRRRLIAFVAFIVVAAALAVAAGSLFGPWVAIGAAVFYGGIAYTLYPLAAAHANDVVPRHETVALSAGMIFASGLGSTFGPLAATTAMRFMGPSGLFVAIAAVAALLGAFATWRALHADPVPPEARSDFMAVTPTTPAATQLDPRAKPGGAAVILDPGEPLPDGSR